MGHIKRSLAIFLGNICLVAAPISVQAQSLPPLYTTIENPVLGDKGMVVSQSSIASEVGADILRNGGNAVDAAIATAFALAVTLPRAGNIGGDGFMLVHIAKENRTYAIDYRSVAPAAAAVDLFLEPDGSVSGEAYRGIKAAGIPGTVAGLYRAHQRFGQLPWKDLVEPAIDLAENGYVLSWDAVDIIERSRDRISAEGVAANVFFKQDGESYTNGERLKHPDLAWSLKNIKIGGADAFYRGPIAKRIVKEMSENDGYITAEDLDNYRAVDREPLVGSYRGVKIVTMPPASGGGASIIELLNILENFDLKAAGWKSAQSYHLMAEAMKLSFSDRFRYATDVDFGTMPLTTMTSKTYAKERAKQMSERSASPMGQTEPGDPFAHESRDTTHFSVVDSQGNAVSNTFTLGSNFGSGVMLDGTGFMLGNLMGNFGIGLEGEERLDGKLRSANKLRGGHRPISSMSPTMLFKDGQLWALVGSPGGNTIPSTISQMIINLVDYDLTVAEATHSPRIYPEYRTGELSVERGVSPDTLRLLEAWGHRVTVDATNGSTQTIVLDIPGVQGAADPRRPGASAVSE
ncbi:gamma-glutamyltransferase [Robiginitomaculum antarcticum]|uniref:gamma-glutamyltransferase n=1 Tax=Robiginitomaculum antarcticum TaxID=437507 RepID=UPI0003689152|nr:gamma-glutamyltransferase [Robiginitomaculum antarcticum]